MKTIFQSIKITLVLCLFLSVGYVMVLTAFASIYNDEKGAAELVNYNGKPVGACQIGQSFTELNYFWGRPSAVDYDASNSGGSNKSADNESYTVTVQNRLTHFLHAHPYLSAKEIPSELITASGSGLDPHLSPASVKLQIRRVASARGIDETSLLKLVDRMIEYSLSGIPCVNVLKLNVELDQLANKQANNGTEC